MNTPGPLLQLRDLDRTSLQFHEQLCTLLSSDEYQDVISELDGEDLTWLVEYLDDVITGISDPASPESKELLRELGGLCGIKNVLPESCIFSDPLPPTSEGTFGGSILRIRRIRIHPDDDPERVKEAYLSPSSGGMETPEPPKIVPLLGVTTNPLQIISDQMPGGHLMEYITNHPDVNRPSLLSDIAEGLNYLHSCDVIHGYLNGSAILVDAGGHARIADFGLAIVTQSLPDIFYKDNGSPWIAPEILNGHGTYSKEADIFSFAGVIIEVFTCAVPNNNTAVKAEDTTMSMVISRLPAPESSRWSGMSYKPPTLTPSPNTQLFRPQPRSRDSAGAGDLNNKPPHTVVSAIKVDKRPPRPTHPDLTDGLWTLVQRCWDQEPHSRPRALRMACGFNTPAWKCLVERSLTLDESTSLIADIFSDHYETEAIKHLHGDDAQSFVDVIDEMLDLLAPSLRRKCLSTLCMICSRQALLPGSVQIPLCYDRMGAPLYRGGYADVWGGEFEGRKVAVKVLTVYATSNLDKITKMFCKEVITWKALRHQNVLPLLGVTMSTNQFAMVSEWMINGNISEFIQVHEDVDRFELLKDVARGLMYIHGEGMIHGDLKGANILIDQHHHACLADFGLVAIISDPAYPTSSHSVTNAGTTKWMSPELLDPGQMGLKDSGPTEESDCYAFGMVIYEVLSGRVPFSECKDYIAIPLIMKGERPGRPEGLEGERFTNGLWETLQLCWSHNREDRPTIKAVSERLEQVSQPRSASISLMKIIKWDGISQDIERVLTTAFGAKDYLDCIKNLPAQGIDPESYINSLDKVIDRLATDSDVRKRCLRALVGACGLYGILPTSYVFTGKLGKPGPRAIASGRSSSVWRITDESAKDQVFAVKSLHVYEKDPIEKINKMYYREVIISKRMTHPNILSTEGVRPDLFEFCMISRWMEHGDIMQYVKKQPEVDRLKLLIDITRGLDYLHNNKIVHGNLCSFNILVDAEGNPRITDFGNCWFTENMDPVDVWNFKGGCAIHCAAPERLGEDKGPTTMADVYSLSMVIVELVTGKMPFLGFRRSRTRMMVTKGERPQEPRRFDAPGMTPDVWKIARKCWHKKAKERPDAHTVLRSLESLANPGTCTREARPRVELECLDLWASQI